MLSEVLKVDPQAVKESLNDLQARGLLTKDNFLTEKGFNTVSRFKQEGRLKPLNPAPAEPAEKEPRPFTALDYTLLRNLAKGRGERSLSSITGIDQRVVTEELDRLYAEGYLTDRTRLTIKGFDSITQPPAGFQVPKGEEGPGATQRSAQERPTRVVLASITTAAYGVFGTILGAIIVLLGFFTGTSSGLTGGNSGLELASLGALSLGGIVVVMGIGGLVSGWWLWRGEARGATGGVALSIGGIATVVTLAYVADAFAVGELAAVICVCNLALMVLFGLSWPMLE